MAASPSPRRNALRATYEPVRERRLDTALDDHPARRCAALAARAEGAPNRSFDGELEISVVKNGERVLAAHLEVNAYVVTPAVGADLPAGFERAGEGHHRDSRVLYQGRARSVAAEYEVDHARRNAGLFQNANKVVRA